jgi:parvulin-like peptidyl-prolyl isomerase
MAKRTKQEKELTKKQIAVSRRQRQQQRRVFIGVGVVAALVLGVALWGLYDQLVWKPSRPVAIVNNAPIGIDQYQKRVLYERFVLDSLLRDLQTQLDSLDPNDSTDQFLAQYFQQVANQVYQQRVGIDQQVLDTMVEEALARQKAAELGLTVSEGELNEAIRARMAGRSGFVTDSQATAIAGTVVAATATAETFTPTPQPTATPTLTATVATTSTPTVSPAPTPTRHIITDAEFSQAYADYLKTLRDRVGVTENEYRSYVQAQLLVQKVAKYFADQVPTEAEQTNVSHIQVNTQPEAEAVRKRLDAGEDFALVASKVSSDTYTAAEGGELGWFLKGELALQLDPSFEEAVSSLSPGQYSQPISSTITAGWHIVKVNERGVHPLSERQLRAQQQQAYTDWLSQAESKGVTLLWKPDMAPPDPLFTTPQPGEVPAGGTQQ